MKHVLSEKTERVVAFTGADFSVYHFLQIGDANLPLFAYFERRNSSAFTPPPRGFFRHSEKSCYLFYIIEHVAFSSHSGAAFARYYKRPSIHQ